MLTREENDALMATIDVSQTDLHVQFTRAERFAGLLRNITVPLATVRAVTVEPDGLNAARGIRAPGLAVPSRRKVGTWRRRGQRTAVSVRKGEPALRVQLNKGKYSELLIGTPNAEGLAHQLASRVRR